MDTSTYRRLAAEADALAEVVSFAADKQRLRAQAANYRKLAERPAPRRRVS